MKKLHGECLCGKVTFVLQDDFKAFYQCHCKQCQQLTGSAFASNLFTTVDNIEWVAGKEHVVTFDHADREFSKAFCRNCGSALPFVNQRKSSLIVPAGSLLDSPSMVPQANIFSSEKACWLDSGLQSKTFEGFPK